MRISLFSQSLFELSLDDAIRTTADLGFEAIELACAEPHMGYERAVKDPSDAAMKIKKAGLAVSALSLFNNFTDREKLEEQVSMAKTFISLASLFDTGLLKMTPGPPASREADETHWQCFGDALSELVQAARDAGVKIAFETHMRNLSDTLSSTERLLEMAPEDCVGLTVDFSNLRFAGENTPQVISKLKGRIYHTHIKNGYIDAEGGFHFGPIDEGLTDYGEALSLLKDADYRGYLSIECLGEDAREHPARTAARDLTILRRYLKREGIENE